MCELGVALLLAFLHLMEIGNGKNLAYAIGPENPLDFRSNFLQTWVAISLIGSLSISLGDSFYETYVQVPI